MKAKAHEHQYAQHPTWPTHAYCKLCGFAVVKTALEKVGIKVGIKVAA